MSLSMDSFTFGGSNNLHGALVPQSPDVPLQVQRVAGLSGETHLSDKPKGRVFTCKCKLRNYSSWSLLMAALDSIHEKKGQLSGTLTVTGNAAATVNRLTFIDVQNERPKLDGSGVHGWHMDIVLVFVQRSI